MQARRDRDGPRRADAPKRGRAPTCASARSAPGPTTRRSCSTPASPSLNLAFGGLDDDGIYHSIYDDFYHFTKFLDTDFAYGRALAQTVGTAVIRLADADVLPFEFTQPRRHSADLRRGAAGAAQGAAGRGARAQPPDRGRRLRVRRRSDVAAVTAPAIEEVPPALNFAPLENAAAALTRAAGPLSQGARRRAADG